VAHRPPSKKESGVTLTTPMTRAGRGNDHSMDLARRIISNSNRIASGDQLAGRFHEAPGDAANQCHLLTQSASRITECPMPWLAASPGASWKRPAN